MAAAPDFLSMVPQGGANVPDAAAANLLGQANIRADATYALGKNQTNYLQEQRPQLRSAVASSGQWYSGARKTALGNQQRHYEDSQYDILHGAHNALDSLSMQQAYAATGLIVG